MGRGRSPQAFRKGLRHGPGWLPARCLAVLCLLMQAGVVAAETGEAPPGQGSAFVLESSTLSLDGALWQATAAGDVTLTYEGTTLEADEVFLDLEKKESFAKGSVRLMHGQDILHCDALSFQWETQIGAIERADLLVESTGYRILAESMEKTGPDTYSAEHSSFTTCLCPEGCRRLPWQVEAEDADLTVGGYARIRKARFRLFDIPVIYVPIGYLPVKVERESGFLMPQISQSGTNGWGFGVPYFWAIDASWDATFLMEGYTRRGPKPNVELRYRPSEQTRGTWNASGFYDLEMEQGRYGVKGRHQQELSRSFYDTLSLNLVSDDTYIEDFSWEVGWTADRLLESNGVLGFRRDNLHVASVATFSQLVDGTGGQRIAQKAPEISAHLFERPVLWPWLFVSLDATGTNYVDENGQDRIRGQVCPEARVAFQPAPGLSLSGYGAVREVLSWGDMDLYNLPWANVPGVSAEEVRHRTLVETGAELNARLGRAFRWGPRRLFHMAQPGLSYQYVREVEGEPFPVEMDGLDTLATRNWFTWSLRTSVWGSAREPGRPGRMLAEMRVMQSLALERYAGRDGQRRLFSDVRVDLQANPLPTLGCTLTVQVDPYTPDLRFLEADVDVWDKKRNYGLNVGFVRHNAYEVNALTRVELVDVYDQDFLFAGIGNTLRAGVTVRPVPWVTAAWNAFYLIDQSGKIENRLTLQYLSRCKCWSALLGVRQTVRPDDVGFSFMVRLEGLGSY